MLGFRSKKMMQTVLIDKQLGPKLDTAKWGPGGREIVQQTDGMRQRVKAGLEKMTETGAEELKEVLVKYLILLFKTAFMSRGISLTEAELGFKWSDSFETEKFGHVDDWTFERASVLFCLAATYAFTAMCRDRATAEGIKDAAGDFQKAAGVLDLLHGEMREAPWKGSPDLSLDTLDTLRKLMLAQAMKCFYEKARDENKSASLMAKMAADCAALYQDVSSCMAQAKAAGRPIGAMPKDWLDVVEWNRLLFDGLQQYYLSAVHLEKFEYGIQLSRLTYATNKCGEAVNATVQANPLIRKQFLDAYELCRSTHEKAKKDNDLLYNEPVPNFVSLPKPERLPKLLVKPTLPAAFTDPATFAEPQSLPTTPVVSREPTPTSAALTEPPVLPPVAAMSAASLEDPPPPSFKEAEALGIEQLVGMGFKRHEAAAALSKNRGSVPAAANELLKGATGASLEDEDPSPPCVLA